MRPLVVTKPKFFFCLIHQVLNPPRTNYPQKIALLNTCSWVLLCSFLDENGGNGQEPRLDPQPPRVGEWGCRGVTAHPGQELKTY